MPIDEAATSSRLMFWRGCIPGRISAGIFSVKSSRFLRLFSRTVKRRSANAPEELLPTRHSLVERLRDLDDHASWRDFFDTYWKLLYGAAIRAGLSDSEAEEVVQETVIGVARKMETFRYDPAICSFKGWLMHVTRCRIADQFRRRKSENVSLHMSEGETADLAQDLPDPRGDHLQSIWEEEWQKNLMDVAIQRIRRMVNAEHYQIFHLHAIKGLGVRDVAKLTGASLPKVYVTYHRLAKLIKAEVQRLEQTAPYA
jgi:RNA polymerase sigma factor (sigma-70 family)